MVVTENPLTVEDRQDLEMYRQQGLVRLGLTETMPPKEIIKVLREYLDEHRQQAAAQEPDDYADFILSFAYLWGDQICRAYQWEWVQLQLDGISGGPHVVAPDRGVRVQPIQLIKDIVDSRQRPNNTQLLFSTLDPDVLKLQLPYVDPGRYLGLH